MDLVLKHWAWYLYCLTFPSNSFAETCCLIFWKNGCLLRHASWLYMAEFGYGLGRCRTRWCSFEWAIWSHSLPLGKNILRGNAYSVLWFPLGMSAMCFATEIEKHEKALRLPWIWPKNYSSGSLWNKWICLKRRLSHPHDVPFNWLLRMLLLCGSFWMRAGVHQPQSQVRSPMFVATSVPMIIQHRTTLCSSKQFLHMDLVWVGNSTTSRQSTLAIAVDACRYQVILERERCAWNFSRQAPTNVDQCMQNDSRWNRAIVEHSVLETSRRNYRQFISSLEESNQNECVPCMEHCEADSVHALFGQKQKVIK